MPFGQHKYKALPDIPSGYLRWLRRKVDLYDPLETQVEVELRLRGLDKPIRADEIEQMTLERIRLVHEGLQQVAGNCDGAQLVDRVGFSKAHTDLGRMLAQKRSLTPREATFGMRVVRRHRKQLSPELRTALELDDQ